MIGRGGAATPGGTDASVLLFPLHDRIQSGELRDLYHYWATLRGSRRMPLRRDVDPAEIADCLPFVGLLEVKRNPVRFLYIYVGTGITTAFGRELTGHYLDELELGRMGARDAGLLQDVLWSGVPSHFTDTLERRNGWQMRQEYLALPLSEDGLRVDLILFGQKWEYLTDRPGKA